MLKLTKILPFNRDDYVNYKIHFAIGPHRNNKKEPLNELVNNRFKEWQENQGRRNFERKYIFSLIYYNKNEFVFGGIYETCSLNLRLLADYPNHVVKCDYFRNNLI